MSAALRDADLTTIGAVSAVAAVACFVAGVVCVAASGVQVLIPETGQTGLDWIADVDSAGGAFFAGAWLTILGGVLLLVAMVGFYDALRSAGPALILAPILVVVGMTLVTVSHLIPIAMAYELVPDYVDASGATKESLASNADTLAITALIVNYTGNILNWGVVVPLYAFAVLRTGIVARWIGWLGVVTGALGGWLGALSPISGVIEGVSSIGFLTFFVWVASMGVALLRRGRAPRVASAAP
jgi:hypothetical protein